MPVSNWGDPIAVTRPAPPPPTWTRRRLLTAGVGAATAIVGGAALGVWGTWNRNGNLAARPMPAEFEPQAGMLMAWNKELTDNDSSALVAILAALHEQLPILLVVSNPETEQRARAALRDRGVPDDSLQFVVADIRYPWIRDYGPIVIPSAAGQHMVVDTIYWDRIPADDRVPRILADSWQLRCESLKLTLEGGNLLSNGEGLCLTTSDVPRANERLHGLGEAEVTRSLQDYFGFNQVVYLEPLLGEATGHADMFATFTDVDQVVVGEFPRDVDSANQRVLEGNAKRLAGLSTSRGPLQVHRVPMLPHDDGVWRSYTNVVFANGRLLVPSYPRQDPDIEALAVATYQRLLPSWEVVPIPCESLSRQQGGPHCATLNVVHLPGCETAG